jgi:hypothetical protein
MSAVPVALAPGVCFPTTTRKRFTSDTASGPRGKAMSAIGDGEFTVARAQCRASFKITAWVQCGTYRKDPARRNITFAIFSR